MTGHGEKLSRLQERAIAALLTHQTIAEAAQALGIGEKTLRRWQKLPAFQSALRAAQARVLDESLGTLQELTSNAVYALAKNLRSGKPATEVRAAGIILQLSLLAADLTEILERLQTLEQNHADQRLSGSEAAPFRAGRIG